MINVISFEKEKKYINDFLKLIKIIYNKNDLMEDTRTTLQILNGEHVLSKYFEISKFIVYKDDAVSGRFLITKYHDDATAYIGFYECIDDDEVARELFDTAKKFCKENGYKSIVGPVDCSFWIKYRLKINMFDLKPYTSEPYNKDYYLKQFEDNDFCICEHYTSQIYPILPDDYKNDKFEEHYKEFIDKGYEIVKPKIEDVDKVIGEVYDMLMDLYNDFPIFKALSLEDFRVQFSGLKSICNMDLVRMAYFKSKPVGFYISIPNYNNLVANINPAKLIKILGIKKKPDDYVMLYMGVNREHTGLGKALSKSIADELIKLKKPSIGALARDGKITQNYAKEVIKGRYEYVLLRKDI